MKRQDLIRHLESHGCRLLREGGKHSVYYNPKDNGAKEKEDEVAEKVPYTDLVD